MPTLLLFNPEHDYALAYGGRNYMAPASVRSLASRMQLLPLLWGAEDDYILTADNKVAQAGNISNIRALSEVIDSITCVDPWGWDEAVRCRLMTLGIPESLVADNKYIETVRRLSHRRISIECNRYLGSNNIPQEFYTVENAMEFALHNEGCYLKLPWSSGGRGVLSTGDLTTSQINEWVRGAIRRQGSVLGERKIDRQLDFASLWDIVDGKVKLDGLSLSISDGRGKYKGNVFGSQEKIKNYIERFSKESLTPVLDLQESFIGKSIAPFYDGKLGIDMICSSDGTIFPCVEINLRRTMGHVAMYYEARADKHLPFKAQLIDIDSLKASCS